MYVYGVDVQVIIEKDEVCVFFGGDRAYLVFFSDDFGWCFCCCIYGVFAFSGVVTATYGYAWWVGRGI